MPERRQGSHGKDLTDLVTAARWNEVPLLSALRDAFPRSRLYLPLAALVGVKNRPETALELGPTLPAHRLRLGNGVAAIPVFTRVALCRECAGRLSWKTDGKPIKTLTLPGTIALEYLQELLADPLVERVIVNPLSDGDLHLARTDIQAIAQGRHLDSLWFYGRRGRLKVPVEIAGDSLFSTLLQKADRAIQTLTERGTAPTVVDVDVIEEALEPKSVPGPVGGLASEIFALVSAENVESLELVLTKSGNEVRVASTPPVSPRLSGRIRAVAEKHWSAAADETTLKFSVRGASMVVSSTSAESSKKRPAPEYSYIPLEPEPEPLPED